MRHWIFVDTLQERVNDYYANEANDHPLWIRFVHSCKVSCKCLSLTSHSKMCPHCGSSPTNIYEYNNIPNFQSHVHALLGRSWCYYCSTESTLLLMLVHYPLHSSCSFSLLFATTHMCFDCNTHARIRECGWMTQMRENAIVSLVCSFCYYYAAHVCYLCAISWMVLIQEFELF